MKLCEDFDFNDLAWTRLHASSTVHRARCHRVRHVTPPILLPYYGALGDIQDDRPPRNQDTNETMLQAQR
eukprot:scaffold232218_cov14-Prasinocladus_malaysianus.AAC.3